MDAIEKLIGLEGGENATWWKILAEVERGMTTYYPAVVDGVEKSYFEFDDLDDYVAHKVKRERMTVRLLVQGNPISAEDTVRDLTGSNCTATGPNTLDVYIDQPDPFAQAAAALGHKGGSSTSERKAAAVRENGKKGGRPRKK